MNLFISKVKLNDLVWTPTPFSQHLILFHGIRLLCHLISILHRLQHLLWSIGTILKLGITSHSILLLCQEIMMRDYSLPKGNTFIVILCIDHLPLDCVLHCLFQVLFVEIFHRHTTGDNCDCFRVEQHKSQPVVGRRRVFWQRVVCKSRASTGKTSSTWCGNTKHNAVHNSSKSMCQWDEKHCPWCGGH